MFEPLSGLEQSAYASVLSDWNFLVVIESSVSLTFFGEAVGLAAGWNEPADSAQNP